MQTATKVADTVRTVSYQEKRISLKLSRLCFTINNDRIWLLWNNGGNSFKIHAGFFKISDYHTSGRFKSSAKLMIRQILPVGVILVYFLGCKQSRWGKWWGDCSFRI